MESALALIIFIAILFGLFVGCFRAFQRNWIAALLLFLFFFPGLMIWALFELLNGPIKE